MKAGKYRMAIAKASRDAHRHFDERGRHHMSEHGCLLCDLMHAGLVVADPLEKAQQAAESIAVGLAADLDMHREIGELLEMLGAYEARLKEAG